MKPAAASRAVWLWIFLGPVLVALAFYFDAAKQGWLMAHRSDAGIDFMRAVSKWGDYPSHVAAGVAGALLSYLIGRRDWTRIFIAMLLACALAGAVNRGVALSTGRSRPAVKENVGWNGPSFDQKYRSFPSGHTSCSMGFFAPLFFFRRRIGLPFFAIPLLIASSRLYLNAHHLSDVVVGALLGLCCGFLVWRWFVRMQPHAPLVQERS
ncbi:MAG: phosphatase PAP2 family protein [Verrucomicrobiota bacterium]|nr:phosphatase PAP2 family protein [Verrucomicrobiota bacterium]